MSGEAAGIKRFCASPPLQGLDGEMEREMEREERDADQKSCKHSRQLVLLFDQQNPASCGDAKATESAFLQLRNIYLSSPSGGTQG